LTLNNDNIVVINTTGGGGGNPFNQSLNTTDNVAFNLVSSGLVEANTLEITNVANDNTDVNLLTWDDVTNVVQYRTVGSLPGGNPFNQSLNTTDSPTFTALTLNTLLDNILPTRSIVSTTAGVIGFKHVFHVTLEFPIQTPAGSIGQNNWTEILGNFALGPTEAGEIVTPIIPDGLITASTPVKCKLTCHISFNCTAAGQTFLFAFGQNPTISPVDPKATYITAATANQIYSTSITEIRTLNTTGTGIWFKNITSNDGIIINSCQIICENI